jgi:4'-phosphopantetheinyl transferase
VSSEVSRAATSEPLRVEARTWSLEPPDEEIDKGFSLLSDDEKARADRFVYARDRREFIAGRAGLRHHLGSFAGMPPAQLTFCYSTQGRPSLAGVSGVRLPGFNLSHSGSLAVAAFAWDCQLGVDIEQVRPIGSDIAGRFFSAAEQRALAALAPGQWLEGFFRCWTRKEAYVKALGVGIGVDLTAFDVTLNPGEPARILRIAGEPAGPRDWRLAALELPEGYVGAVAVKTNGRNLRLEQDGRLVSPGVE